MYKKLAVFILIAIALLILFLNYNFLYNKIIGLASLSNIEVNVKEKIGAKIFLTFQPFVELGNTQKIYVEFINTGTSPVTTKIEVRIYSYSEGTLKPLAYYYDISVPLNPGVRTVYSTVFVPPSTGLYYVQARAPYDGKFIEVWSAFSVYYPPVPPVIILTALPAPSAAPPVAGVPKLNLSFPEKVSVFQGESTLISIRVKNVGDVELRNLKLYISATGLINFNVNPKQIARLYPNDSSVFLISVYVPMTTPEGLYPFDFEVMSDEIQEGRSITLEVSSVRLPEEEEIQQKILNYQFLISEIEQEILSESSKGFDVSLANQSLNNAKSSLETVKSYFRLRKFEDAKSELENVRKSLEDAVFQLASITLYVYRPFAFVPLLILLLIIILIIIGILIYYYRKRKRERRPKLLRALTETET